MPLRLLCLLLILLSAIGSSAVFAHKSSDGFLYLNGDAPQNGGRLDLALPDLVREFALDANEDRQVSWGELEDAMPAIQRSLAAGVSLSRGNQDCPVEWSARGVTQHSDGAYLSLQFLARCPEAAQGGEQLEYNLFFDTDPLHRLLVMNRQDGTDHLSVLGPNQRTLRLDSPPTAWQMVVNFGWQGMVHLWIGFDHMLFLLALVLPAAVRREQGRWIVEDSLGAAVKDVALVVTAFTLAHSITLVAASLGLVRFDIEWIETLIALSIVAAAVNVVWPFLGRRRYLMGFGFGLIHGFGFASVLSDFMASTANRALALGSFNLGVELAQLVVVAAVVPLLFLFRRRWLYRTVVMPSGVAAIAAIGLLWVVERAPV